MDLYLDSADLDEIRAARDLGEHGVTTNPSIIAKAARTFTNAWPPFANCAKDPSPQK